MSQDALGYYQILNVDCKATVEQIKNSYRELVKIWHPDRNHAEGALEKFQKISEAWEILSTDDGRINYDLLSCVYNSNNYPEIENIRPYNDGMADIRAISIYKVKGLIWKYNAEKKLEVCAWQQALQKQTKSAISNWLLGWWSPQAILKNIRALYFNWQNPISQVESLRILVHNLVAYHLQNKPEMSVSMAIRALEFADTNTAELLKSFIQKQNIRVPKPKKWNLLYLRLCQLVVPLIFCLAAIASLGANYMTEGDLWNWFAEKKEIDYYQEVRFGKKVTSVDDVVVGKILNIPVDRSDITNLWHLKSKTDVMYGPGEDFDIIKTLPADTTVRLTGKSPDNIWARVMIDNGEMGFVYLDAIEQGIGAEIPFGSKIFEK